MMDKMDKYYEIIVTWLVQNGPRFIGAILLLVIGLWIIKKVTKVAKTRFEKKKVDVTLFPFLLSIINILLKVLLLISVMSMMGVAMTSFVAILGAAGLAIGLALSGTLQNFAGGVMILLLKPYVVSDYIAVDSYEGVVQEVQIFSTILKTLDNKIVIIPNSNISSNSLINYTRAEQRLLDFTFGIAYGDSVDKARDIIKGILDKNKLVDQTKDKMIFVKELGDSSVNLGVRAWINTADYWTGTWAINESVYKELSANGISIPFPQMDVHIQK